MGSPKLLVRLITVVIAGLYSLGLFLSGAALLPWINQFFAALPVIAGLLLLLWDAFALRLPVLRQLTKRPYIAGFYAITYRPTKESHIPDGGNRGPIPGFMVIRQSFWFITVRSYTKESRSDSRSFFWTFQPGTDFASLSFTYENLPKESESHRSTRHFGATHLDITSGAPKSIEGSYFTDRYTKGDMTIKLIDRSHGHSSFEAAKTAAQAKRK